MVDVYAKFCGSDVSGNVGVDATRTMGRCMDSGLSGGLCKLE